MTRRTAFLAGLMMATCVLLSIEARLAKTDAVLLLCCVAAMGVMARAYLAQSTGRDIPWRHALLLWTALAAGILLKGPLILMVVGLAALALVIADRSARWLMRLRPLVGVLWILRAGAALVRGDHGPRRRQLPAGIGRAGPARQDLQGAGDPRRAARLLPGCCSGSRSGPLHRLPRLQRQRCGGIAASRRCASCWHGSCRAGSCSSWSSPSCRTTCCRSIRRLRS